MKCPNCGSTNTTVIDTRNKNGQLRRRRVCNDCNKLFLTLEILNDNHLFVIEPEFKKRGTFKRQKLLNSIIKAAYESDISVKEINDFIDSIELGENRDYSTDEIFEKTCDFLKNKDYQTYVRYAVKHKKFILEEDRNDIK